MDTEASITLFVTSLCHGGTERLQGDGREAERYRGGRGGHCDGDGKERTVNEGRERRQRRGNDDGIGGKERK